MSVPEQTLLGFTLGRMVRAFESVLGRRYSHRHPGSLSRFLISLLKPVVVRCTPNDKWNLHVFVPEWLSGLRNPPLQPLPEAKRIFLFCAYRIEFTLNLNLAVLLAWRGHRVTIGYLPKLQSPIKEPRRDHPSAKRYLASALKDVYRLSAGHICCIDLSDMANADQPLDEAFIARQVTSDVVMAVKRETFDLDDPEVKGNLAYYLGVARDAQRAAWSHLSAHRMDYDLCLIPNGTTFEGAQVCHVAKQLNIPVNTFEKFAFKNIRVINHGDNFLAFHDLDLAWNLRLTAGYKDEPFCSRACGRAMELLNERRTNSTKTWGWKLQTAPPQSVEEALAEQGLGKEEPFVLVCTNVPYDAGYEGLRSIFPSMRDWLIETVRCLLGHSNLTVIVRAHPGEAAHYGGKERSEQTLLKAGIVSDRLIVIPAEARVNTYALMEACRFGVVFSSTAGLEMAMMGKTVLIGSHVYYARRGFTVDAKDHADYFYQIQQLTDGVAPLGLRPEQAREARLFHFILHCVMQWPYPYDKPSSIRAFPPAKLLSSRRIGEYLNTLDVLTMNDSEWRTRALDYIRVDGSNHVMERMAEA